jgi:hypothetical protein
MPKPFTTYAGRRAFTALHNHNDQCNGQWITMRTWAVASEAFQTRYCARCHDQVTYVRIAGEDAWTPDYYQHINRHPHAIKPQAPQKH